MSARTTAFRIGRRIGKHPLASRAFCLSERFLPVERLARSNRVVAFRHPRPSWEPHILIVPTIPFPALITPKLSIETKSAILNEAIVLARRVAEGENRDSTWFLIINGGVRQEIGQVHGHLIQESQTLVSTVYAITNETNWVPILTALQKASENPDNGYSLVIDLEHETAWVTQSQ